MAEFNINRGIGKSVEFRGLRAQYVFLFVGGLIAIFILYVLMYTVGINQWACIAFNGCMIVTLVTIVYRLNKQYGPNGLMKLAATRNRPRNIINRKRVSRLIKEQMYEKYA